MAAVIQLTFGVSYHPRQVGRLCQALRWSPQKPARRARILLKADDGLSDEEIAAALDVGTATVGRTRQRFVEESLGALDEHSRPGAQRKLTGKQEARLIAVACTPAPEGHARWTLRLLADKVVELGFADALAHETVRRVLKKTPLNRGNKSNGVCRK
jgi:putative transposase